MNFFGAIISSSLLILYSFAALHYKDDPACDKSNLVPNTFMENCCPTLPHFMDQEIFTGCAQHCAMWISNPNQPGAKKCCILNCTLTAADVMRKNETFIADKMALFYQKTVKPENTNVWFPIIKKVISSCRAMAMKFKEPEIEEMSPQCETVNITLALNITRCIRRELFFECKDKPMETENCKLLKGFGMDCVYWPFQCYRKKLYGGIEKATYNKYFIN